MIKIKYFFTADTHFSHKNILTYCKRPFKTIEEMDKTLINNWNSRVTSDDIVFHLGDFSLSSGNPNKYLKQLNGKIIWIKGNHDRGTIIQDMIIEHGGHSWHLTHNPIDCEAEYNLCGHVHEKWLIKREKSKIIVNVGVDVHNYFPVTINEILKVIKDEEYKET